MKIKWDLLVGSIILCHLPGIIGSIATMMNLGWYETLQKPWFTPPGIMISIIWLTLYTLMGISLYLVLNNNKISKIKMPMFYFGVQAFFNAFWSISFFGLHTIIFSFIVIICLISFSIIWLVSFALIDKRIYWLLMPYIIWLWIAASLNLCLIFLNPGVL